MSGNRVQISFHASDDTESGLARVRAAIRRLQSDVRREMGRAGGEAGREFSRNFEQHTRRDNDRIRRIFQESGRSSGRGFGGGFMGGFMRLTGSAIKGVLNIFGNAGDRAADFFSDGFSKVAQLLQSNPYVAAGALAVGTTVATLASGLIVSAISGAVVLGLGGAFVAVGALMAMQNRKVKAEWSSTLSYLKGQFADAAKPMIPVLMNAMSVLRRMGAAIAPVFKQGLAAAAPALDSFIGRLGNGLTKGIQNNLGQIMRGFSDLLGQINIEGFISSLMDAFGRLASTVSRNKEVIGATFNFILGLIVQVINVVNGAMVVFGKLAAPFVPLLEKLGLASKSTDGFGNSLDSLGGKADGANQALSDMLASMNELAQKTLTGRSTMRDFEQAIDDAAKSLKENGRTLDINTQKGRDNQAALDRVASSALGVASAMKEQGKSNTEIAAQLDIARANFVSLAMQMGMTQGQAESLADQMGLTGDAVNNIPAEKTVNVKQNGAPKTKSWMDRVKGAVHLIPGSWMIKIAQKGASTVSSWAHRAAGAIRGIPNKVAKIAQSGASGVIGWAKKAASWIRGIPNKLSHIRQSGAGGVIGAARSVRGALNSIPRRVTSTITRVVNHVTNWITRHFASGGVVGASGYANGGVVGRAAGGGPRSNTVLVGEQGPELVDLAPGSKVTPAGQTASILNRQNNGPAEVTIVIESGDSALDRLLVEVLRRAIKKNHGGNVQAALGRG